MLGVGAVLAASQYGGSVVAAPSPQSAGIAAAVAQWKAIQQGGTIPFDTYASFLGAHPGWPGETAARRAAEKAAGSGYASASSIAAFCRRFPALTADGAVACARGFAATGAGAAANESVRRGWRMGRMSSDSEAAVLGQFTGALTPADHNARMDALLWQAQVTAAARQLPFTSPAARPLLQARLAFRTRSAEAAALASANDAAGARDAGYIADKAIWLRNSGGSLAARNWLARPRAGMTQPGNVEEWYEVLLTNARAAAADRQYQLAYDIARQVDDGYPAGTDVSAKPYGERDDYTSLVWLAGTTAMKDLRRPADAVGMFTRYGNGSRAPQTRAKGLYWAARAAEAAGQTAASRALFERTGQYRAQYYGQLALEHMGQPLTAPPVAPAVQLSPGAREAFYARETVQAAQLLGRIGQHKDQSAFIRQIADAAETPQDHLLNAELSRSMGRPDLAVWTGRAAMIDGLEEYSAVAFPTVPVPAGFEDQWTPIHAVIRQESQFDREAMSPVGARGLMQLMPGTAREQAGKMGLPYDQSRLTGDPSYNITLGSSYFQRVFGIYGSYPLAIAAYNAGPGNVNKWLRANGDPRTGAVDTVDWVEAIPYLETRNYVQRVLENAVVYDLMNPSRAKSRGPANLSWYLGRRPG